MIHNNLNRQQRRAARKYLEQKQAQMPKTWREVPRSEWSKTAIDPKRKKVWINRNFVVQVFAEANGNIRLSINRTAINKAGDWNDQISWEELQRIKNDIGYSEFDAVEIFPAESDTVNVSNMRHLWVLPDKLPFAWR